MVDQNVVGGLVFIINSLQMGFVVRSMWYEVGVGDQFVVDFKVGNNLQGFLGMGFFCEDVVMDFIVYLLDIVEGKFLENGGSKCFYSCCVVLKNLVLE